ncbi:MAG: acyl carrier protein [Chroococcidiopsidaceae cyanobacterium CP_BM_RX_35]|nr:acyl carrier protein [Chroococcidiopsidaceae cyanobacterium CP_BM_RX_35]
MEVQNLSVNEMSAAPENQAVKEQASKKSPTAAEIQDWIVAYLAELLEIQPEEVDITIPFDRYGLDSSAAVGLTGDLEDWLGEEVDPTLLYDYPTVESLVEHLSWKFKTKS